MKLTLISWLIFVICASFSKCARILGIFPIPAKSHYFLGNALLKGLAEAGHDVTMISPFINKDPPARGSYRDVYLSGVYEHFQAQHNRKDMNGTEEPNHITRSLMMQKIINVYCEALLMHPNVQILLRSEESFDVVLFEHFSNDALKALAYRFNAHLVVFSSVGASSWFNDMVGNPSPLSYIPQVVTNYSPQMSFLQRTHNTLMYIIDEILKFNIFLKQQEELMRRIFPSSPNMDDIYTNVALVLLNAHESYCQAIPLVPNMVNIGGFHIQALKTLPGDLQEFLDSASDGAIYFSMGTNLNVKDMPESKRDVFLKVFGKLKQKVLWKWEDDVLLGQPPNVKIAKWLPQSDILAHPNVKLFITHGGMLSTSETIYHGVPILAMPVFADQFLNAKSAEYNGFALVMPYKDPEFSEEKLSSLLNELLYNKTYAESAKFRSKLFHDRPMTPMETAVYWVEYIIRSNGAHHLRVVGKDLPWYKYFLLDVIGFIILSVLILLTLVYVGSKQVFKVVRRLLWRQEKVKEN